MASPEFDLSGFERIVDTSEDVDPGPTDMDREAADRRTRLLVEETDLHRHLGLTLVTQQPGFAAVEFDAGKAHLTPFGVVHAGVLYTLMEAAAFLGLMPMLRQAEHAATHDLHVSVMRSIVEGERVTLTARVVRRGRTLAFIDTDAKVDDRLMATGRVTKSILQVVPDAG